MAAEVKLLNSDGTVSNISAKSVVIPLTKSEFSESTSENFLEYYSDGVRAILIDEDFVNLIPTAIGENGSVLYGCGYMNGYRLNSSGGIQTSNASVLTGYIPYEYGKEIRIEGGLNPANAGGQYVAAYDSSFNLLFINYLSSLIGNSGGRSVCTDDGIYIHTINTSTFASSENVNGFKAAAYIRVSLSPCIGSKMKVSYK